MAGSTGSVASFNVDNCQKVIFKKSKDKYSLL